MSDVLITSVNMNPNIDPPPAVRHYKFIQRQNPISVLCQPLSWLLQTVNVMSPKSCELW